MLPSWKRIYVFGGLCCAATAASFLQSNEEVSQALIPVAEARELSPSVAALAGDRTRALELRFETSSATLTRNSEDTLASFLRSPEGGRVREFKVITWAPVGADPAAARDLAARRGEVLRGLLANAETPATAVVFAERANENANGAPAEAAVLAVME